MLSSNSQGLPETECSDLRGVRVLVVEDAWRLATALKGLLETLGLEVVGPAATIFEAERLAAACMPEVAVVNLNLKGEMAYGLINQLHDGGVAVIVVSGYVVLPRLTEKAALILQMPFNGPELVAALHKATDSKVFAPRVYSGRTDADGKGGKARYDRESGRSRGF